MACRCKSEHLVTSEDSRANDIPSPRSTRHPRSKSSGRVQKYETPRRTSARLQGKILGTASSLDLLQTPSDGCKEQVTRQRKRRRNSEEEPQLTSKAPPEKRAKNSASTVSDKSQPLNAQNLKNHTVREGYVSILELMDSEPGNILGSRGSKRSASRSRVRNRSIASTGIEDLETTSQATQKSSYTAAHYRLSILVRADIVFRFSPAPEHVCTRITAIVQRPVLDTRKKELLLIAHTLYDQFIPVLSRAAREDDCVELLHQALSALGYGSSLLLPRKADWELRLKPRTRSPMLNLSFLNSSQDEAEDSPDRPNKQQHGDGANPSPHTAAEQMGPPPAPQSGIKTPRPDISIGLSNDAVIQALQSRNLSRKVAIDFLTALAAPDARNGGKPLLCLESTKQEAQIRFPFVLVEGKSYATGRTIYEAQNQAAVSGACALEILHQLDDLTQKATPSSHSKGQHIVFSICTQGPIHELWVHFTTEEDGDRMYNSKIWKSCNMAVECEVPGFVEALDNVMRWGTEEHLEKIADQLKTVWAASLPPSYTLSLHHSKDQ